MSDQRPPFDPDPQLVELMRRLLAAGPDGQSPQEMLRRMRQELNMFLLHYEFGLKEIETKVEILNEEHAALAAHNPIEHVKTRVKSLESLLQKMQRIQCPPELDAIRASIRDIAGVRITCRYVSDCYRVADMLSAQQDITMLELKDYIRTPKPNGYRSLHLIVQVPVFLASGAVQVPVEIQIRTIAMDFWASAEHELIYKFRGDLPEHLASTLREIALTAADLDAQMTQIRTDAGADPDPTVSQRPAQNSSVATSPT